MASPIGGSAVERIRPYAHNKEIIMTNKAGTKKVAGMKIASVALQQRSGEQGSENGVRKYAELPPDQLHRQTLSAREALFGMCVDAKTYTYDVVLPYCEEIIARYRMPGVGAKDRPNGKPTVEAYFRSIKLRYSTVRSWLRRKNKKLSVTEIFEPEKSTSTNPHGKVPHLTQLEARLLATAAAGHDLVKAFRQSGNVDEAIKEFEEHAPTPDRIEEYIVRRPVNVVATELEKLAVRLCKLIDKKDDKHGQKILALARELLTKAEPITVEQVLAEGKKRPQGVAGKAIARRAA
jgi:hypothetical protein